MDLSCLPTASSARTSFLLCRACSPGPPQFLLCRVEGEVHAITTECPHAGGRIVEGPMKDGRFAVCPLHQYAFDPRTGRPEGDLCSKAQTYRVREEGDECRVWL